VRGPMGNAVPGGVVGRYVVDGTRPAGFAYLVDLSGELKASGCRIFRVAGRWEVGSFYEDERKSLQNPDLEPIQVLRGTLAAIREGAGGDSILVGDWNTPMELPGLLDGAVPLTMPEDGVEPLEQEGFAASRGYFRHRGAWWVECFPVARWVGEDGGDDQREWARSRVLFAALTGRGLLLDESTALFPWAQELFRAAGPTAPVRPIDLFPSRGLPHVWDLKLGDGGMGGDLVGLFNWSTLSSTAVAMHPRDLGLSWGKGKNYIYFDVFSGACVGRSDGPMEFFLRPGRSRLVSVQRDLERPQIVAASGPYLALGSQLEDVRWDEKALELSGRAWVPGGQALGSEELRLHILCGPAFKASSASAEGGRAEVSAAGGDVVLTLQPCSASSLPFRILFTPSSGELPLESLLPPRDLRVTFIESERKPLVAWSAAAEGIEWW